MHPLEEIFTYCPIKNKKLKSATQEKLNSSNAAGSQKIIFTKFSGKE